MEDLLRIIISCAVSILVSYVISKVIYGSASVGILVTIVWEICSVVWFACAVFSLGAWLTGTPWSEIVSALPSGWWWVYASLLLFSGPAIQEIGAARRRAQ